MKKLTLGFGVLFLMMALGFQAMSQSGLSVVPENPSAWDEITVRLDVSLTCPADALLEVDSVMMHSGLTIGGVSWQNTVGFDSEGANGQKPKLMKVIPSATITPANATAWDE
nr:hypothetical protein [Bacteroidota bacterium]